MAAVWFHRLEGRILDELGRPLTGGSGMWVIGHDDGTVTWEPGTRARRRAASGTFPNTEDEEIPDSVRTIRVQTLATERARTKTPVRVPNDRPMPPPPPVKPPPRVDPPPTPVPDIDDLPGLDLRPDRATRGRP